MTENVVAGAVRIDNPKNARKVFLDAFNAGDINRLTNLFEPEAVIVVSPGQVITGLIAIRESFCAVPSDVATVGNQADQPSTSGRYRSQHRRAHVIQRRP